MSNSRSGWIGVDLDGTLAHYDGWKGEHHIGEPIVPMVKRVRAWLDQGKSVKIFTARVCPDVRKDAGVTVRVIEDWCLANLGRVLPITHEKDLHMIELWDDRAVQVILNTGIRADGKE